MVTLEGKAREWYEGLDPGSLFSLKDFHKVFYEHYKENCSSLLLAENCWDQSEALIQYLVNIDEDLGNWHPEDLVEEIHAFHTQVNFHENQEELFEDDINQEIKEDPQDLFKGTSDDSSSLLCKAQEDIQCHDLT